VSAPRILPDVLQGRGGYEAAQLGAAVNYAESVRGVRLDLVNVARRASGLQVGLVDRAESLRGERVGLVNYAEDGLLPRTAPLNMGFGDDEARVVPDENCGECVGDALGSRAAPLAKAPACASLAGADVTEANGRHSVAGDVVVVDELGVHQTHTGPGGRPSPHVAPPSATAFAFVRSRRA
jgi:hypothetical protein